MQNKMCTNMRSTSEQRGLCRSWPHSSNWFLLLLLLLLHSWGFILINSKSRFWFSRSGAQGVRPTASRKCVMRIWDRPRASGWSFRIHKPLKHSRTLSLCVTVGGGGCGFFPLRNQWPRGYWQPSWHPSVIHTLRHQLARPISDRHTPNLSATGLRWFGGDI